jgi:NAD(P)-dependent dehydrogenase (short-subunit alcohol dehydrogenase family)
MSGLEGPTKAIVVELAPQDIGVNSVAPPFIEALMTQPMLDNPEFRSFVDRMIPPGRMGKPADVATAVLYLGPRRQIRSLARACWSMAAGLRNNVSAVANLPR